MMYNDESFVHIEQERGDVLVEFEKSAKHIKNAVGFSVVIALVNVLLGSLMTFFPEIFYSLGLFDPADNLGLIIFGLIYTGLSFGISRHSRVCVIIASVVFVADALMIFLDSFEDMAAAFRFGESLVMKVILLVGLVSGIKGCFKYHKLKNKYMDHYDSYIASLVENSKPKAKASLIVTCVIVGCVGLASFGYGFFVVEMEGRDFDDWVDHSLGSVTIKMPSQRVLTTSEPLFDTPGVSMTTSESVAAKAEAVLMRYENLWTVLGSEWKNDGYYEVFLMHGMVDELGSGWRVIDQSDGTMGETMYWDVRAENGGYPCAIRCFSDGNDMYVAIVLIYDFDEDNFVGKFLDSIIVK